MRYLISAIIMNIPVGLSRLLPRYFLFFWPAGVLIVSCMCVAKIIIKKGSKKYKRVFSFGV